MKVLTCAATGQSVQLINQIASSGEGEIWRTDRPGLLAKIYFTPDPQRVRKLEGMVANPPRDPNAHINHISFAWAKSLLQDSRGQCVGFLMPEITRSVQILDVYNPLRRQRILPGFNWLYLHTTAMNIASIIGAIHQAGYVVGDIKPENILVNDRALPAIIDTDSFQVRNPQTGELFHCRVGSDGFTPVELLGKDLGSTEQTEVHDRFRLGVIIHLLLFGDYPFKGRWVGMGDSPPPIELLRQGYWCYAPHSLVQPGPLTIPLETVHPALQQCFLRCFNGGHKNPEARPAPVEWLNALQLARSELVICQKIKNHYYSQTYGKCYWCERCKTLGVDIFPTVATPPHPAVKSFRQWSDRLRQNLRKWNTQPLATRLQSSLQNWKMTSPGSLAWIRPAPGSPSSPPIPTPNPAPPALPVWKRSSTAIAALAVVFALLLFLSRSKVDTQELELSLVGVFLCLGLVAIGFLWLKVLDKTSS
jgi:DNA-binding helix-hairpin-helix protein with protein kinase domain